MINIIATLGPASDDKTVLKKMYESGANVFRLNTSHETVLSHKKRVELINSLFKDEVSKPAILVDLPGPKIRIKDISQNPMLLMKNDPVYILSSEKLKKNIPEKSYFITLTEPEAVNELKEGDSIFLNDGYVLIKIEKIVAPGVLKCKTVIGGEIRKGKGLNSPSFGSHLKVPTEKDMEIAKQMYESGVRLFCLSFVMKPENVQKFKEELSKHTNGKNDFFVISKIEKKKALENLEEIVKISDGIMVARGDLGVELAVEEVGIFQKRIINTCKKHKKPVIVATQMLESMTTHKRPTRAEVSDVTNAVLDGAHTLMLSEETAIGKYPVETVATMSKIINLTYIYLYEKKHRINPKNYRHIFPFDDIRFIYEHSKTPYRSFCEKISARRTVLNFVVTKNTELLQFCNLVYGTFGINENLKEYSHTIEFILEKLKKEFSLHKDEFI